MITNAAYADEENLPFLYLAAAFLCSHYLAGRILFTSPIYNVRLKCCSLAGSIFIG